MENFVKKENERILNSPLTVIWWNMGTKTKEFEGTAKEYIKRHNVKLKIKYFNEDNLLSSPRCSINISFSIGRLNNICFSCTCIEVAIQMILNIRLAYMCDKSKFIFLGRIKTINF
jgi:hypothetical protein